MNTPVNPRFYFIKSFKNKGEVMNASHEKHTICVCDYCGKKFITRDKRTKVCNDPICQAEHDLKMSNQNKLRYKLKKIRKASDAL